MGDPPAAGDQIDVTLSAENDEALKAGQTVTGRFHGVVRKAATSGAESRSSDFGS